jgi:hypothetical protein
MVSSFQKTMKEDTLNAGITRRQFVKYSAATGGALLLGIHGGMAMARPKKGSSLLLTLIARLV